MRHTTLMSKDISSHLPLIHPPEPKKQYLLSDPGNSIYLGKTRWLSVPVFWDYKKLINPHIAIVGITGSGKSYLVKTFITRSSLIWNTNTIILDWAGEYGKWVKQAGGRVLDLSTEHLNLLDLCGVSSDERIRQILSSLDLLANLTTFPTEREEIESALEAAYASKPKPKTEDLLNILKKRKNNRARRIIQRLTAQGSAFFSGETSFDISKLLTSGLICLDLHALPNEELRSLTGLTFLQFIKEKMRKEEVEDKKGIKLFVVLDEAWKIAQDARSDVITIIREGRKYNFALIIASQNPTDMHQTIFSNVGTMFILRLVLKEFRDHVKNSLNYSQYIDSEISKFGVGDGALHMIFAEKQAKAQTFLLEKIDGEEPLFIFKIKGEVMEIEIEREHLIRVLYELGLNEEQMSIIKDSFERGDGTLMGAKLVEMLETFGYSKTTIISFLRQLGIAEKNIIELFSLVKRKKAARGVVDVILEE